MSPLAAFRRSSVPVPRQTLTVIGPHGSEVTVLKPGLGKVIVIAQAGATVRGMRFDHPTLLNVSDHYAASSLGRARSPSPPSSADQEHPMANFGRHRPASANTVV